MFNVGGGELIVIMIIALIVLGPEKLPDAVRRAGRLYGELRRMSSGFQAELRDVLEDPMREVRSTTDLVKDTFSNSFYDHEGEEAEHEPTRPAGPDAGQADGSVDAASGGADGGARTAGAADSAEVVQGDRPGALPSPVGARDASMPPPPVGAPDLSLPPPPGS